VGIKLKFSKDRKIKPGKKRHCGVDNSAEKTKNKTKNRIHNSIKLMLVIR
jgi:hypothetical protein